MNVDSHLIAGSSVEFRQFLCEVSTPGGISVNAAGQLYYDSTAANKQPRWYDGTAWFPVLKTNIVESISAQWDFTDATSPFTVTGTTVVTNLNADYVDGEHASDNVTADTIASRYTDGRLKVGEPSDSQDATTLGYVTAAIAGATDPKAAVKYTTAAALDSYTFLSNVLTAVANGALTVDGQTPAVSDRIGVVNESGANEKYNGIYTVTTVGDGSTQWVLTRATDADEDSEVTNGMQFWTTAGDTNNSSGWLLTTSDPITLNTTALTFVQNNGTATITVTDSLNKDGNELSVKIAGGKTWTANSIVFTDTTTSLDEGQDTDDHGFLGRMWIGYNGATSDSAQLGHFDQRGVGGYALAQSPTGTTSINAASGTVIQLNIANATKWNVSATSLQSNGAGIIDSSSSTLTVGTVGASSLIFKTNDTTEWSILSGGNLQATDATSITTAAGALTLAPNTTTNLSGFSDNSVLFISGASGAISEDTDGLTYSESDVAFAIGSAQQAAQALRVVRSGAQTVTQYGGVIDVTATSSTASVDKHGLWVSSTGTWNGTSAVNYGIKINAVSGGTTNWALYNNTSADVYLGSGSVGIGTTVLGSNSPLVIVNSDGTNAHIRMSQDADPDTNYAGLRRDNTGDFVIDTSGTDRFLINGGTGNVGIGTTGPGTLLELQTGGASCPITLACFSATAGHGPQIVAEKGASNTKGTYTATADGETLFDLKVYGSDTGNTISELASFITFEQDGAGGASYIPTRIRFATGTNAATATEAMRIDSSQVVQINTPNTDLFSSQLVVDGDINVIKSNPNYRMDDQSQAADNRAWDVGVNAGSFFVRTINNAGSSSSNAITIARTGINIDSIIFACDDDVTNLTLSGASGSEAAVFQGGLKINEAQINGDSFIRGQGNANVLHVDASEDSVGIGTTALGNWLLKVGGSFTSDGAGVTSGGVLFQTTLTGANGDTTSLTSAWFQGSITTQGNTETIADVATVLISEPAITVGTGDTVTNASTLKIVSAPTEGTNNYALWVDAGNVRIDSLATANGIVQTDGSGVLSSSTDLPSGTTINSLALARFVSVPVVGDDANEEITVTHNLNNLHPDVTVWLANTSNVATEVIIVDVVPVDANSIQLQFTNVQASSDHYRVAVVG